jgi:hypothetical protein
MSDATDVMRVLLAEENANWRHLAANSDITESLGIALDEMRVRHVALKADLPAAIAAHTAAERACDAAQRRFNTIIGRINRVAALRLSPALETILDAEDRRYRAAQVAMTRARQALAQLKWDIECLGANITQTEAALTPASPQLMEVAKRPERTEVETDDDIIFPVTMPRVA